MGQKIELEIQRRLLQSTDAATVAKELLADPETDELPREDFFALVTFAFHAGVYKDLLSAYTRWFRRSPTVPWAQFIELVNVCEPSVERDLVKNVITGARAQEAFTQAVLSHRWDRHSSQFSKGRERHREELLTALKERHALLKEKLTFLRAQRMIEEEEKILSQLRREFPDDPDVTEAQKTFEERWAREVIARSQAASNEVRDLSDQSHQRLSPKEETFAKNLLDHCLNEKPARAYDFALMFYFMGLPEYALAILRRAPSNPSVDWFLLELLMEARHFIECLEATNAVEAAYSQDPETVFGANYIRARCLWSLGQSVAAIDLMKSIINVRPDYRSARSFLAKWTGGLS